MRAPLCCLQHSHVYQKMRKTSLLPIISSLNRKEQLKKHHRPPTMPTCPAWGGVVVKLLPVDFAFFSTAAFTIPNYPLKMHMGQWPVFLRTLGMPGQKNSAYVSLYWLFMLFCETYCLFQSRVVKVGLTTCASSPSVCAEHCLCPEHLQAAGIALPSAGSG